MISAGAMDWTRMTDWVVLPDAEAVARSAAQRIVAAAAKVIRQQGFFRLVLAGGSTPRQVYQLLAAEDAEWSKWHIYFGDERCLPSTYPGRNSNMAQLALLDQVGIPAEQVHPIPSELGAEAAAEYYDEILQQAVPFHLVLLGLGEDGHTASLFPDHVHPGSRLAVAVHDAPKPPSDRVSMSATALSDTQRLMFIVTGSGKRNAVRIWHGGDPIPASTVKGRVSTEVLIDRAAWPL